MIIVGIDPGLASTGYGVIDHQTNSSRLVGSGTIITAAGTPLPERLLTIYQRLTEVLVDAKPEAVAVEELFFSNNAVSVMGVAQARGVAVLAACQPGVAVFEYTPLQVKQAVTGSGRADKTQVHRMVEILLGIRQAAGAPVSDEPARGARTVHESDALAIALCHAQTGRMDGLIRSAQLTGALPIASRGRRSARRR